MWESVSITSFNKAVRKLLYFKAIVVAKEHDTMQRKYYIFEKDSETYQNYSKLLGSEDLGMLHMERLENKGQRLKLPMCLVFHVLKCVSCSMKYV